MRDNLMNTMIVTSRLLAGKTASCRRSGDAPLLISRRGFLLLGVSAAIAPVLDLRGAVDSPVVGVRDLNIEVPRLLFFPECRSEELEHCEVRRVYIEVLQYNRRESDVVVQFSNGRNLVFDSDMSYATSAGPMRERVILKSLAAWAIAGARQMAPLVPGSSFAALQEQAVLEAVSPGSVFELVEQLRRNRSASEVAWDASGSRFVVQ